MAVDTVMELEALPPTLTVAEAGELLGISRRSAYRAVERGDLPALRLGRRLVVPSLKLLELLGVEPAIGTIQREPRQRGGAG